MANLGPPTDASHPTPSESYLALANMIPFSSINPDPLTWSLPQSISSPLLSPTPMIIKKAAYLFILPIWGAAASPISGLDLTTHLKARAASGGNTVKIDSPSWVQLYIRPTSSSFFTHFPSVIFAWLYPNMTTPTLEIPNMMAAWKPYAVLTREFQLAFGRM